MSVTIEKKPHPTWEQGVVMQNEHVELVVSADVGPNIVHVSLPGKPNMMRIFGRDVAPHGKTQWRPYGGHRLWHAPESWEGTYIFDAIPVQMQLRKDGVDATQAVEEKTFMQKHISVTLMRDGSVQIDHTWRNCGVWAVETAAWAISVLDKTGVLWAPQAKTNTDLLHNRIIALWPYSSMDDPRVTWGKRSVMLRQDPAIAPAFKFGMSVDEGVMAYFVHGQMLVKRIELTPGAAYPDGGCMVESYTNGDLLEMETLSPFATLAPGESLSHREVWRVFACDMPRNEDEAEAAVRDALAK